MNQEAAKLQIGLKKSKYYMGFFHSKNIANFEAISISILTPLISENLEERKHLPNQSRGHTVSLIEATA